MQDDGIEILSETEAYSLWRVKEPDGETTYHLELGTVTVHFFREEWEEMVELIREATRATER